MMTFFLGVTTLLTLSPTKVSEEKFILDGKEKDFQNLPSEHHHYHKIIQNKSFPTFKMNEPHSTDVKEKINQLENSIDKKFFLSVSNLL